MSKPDASKGQWDRQLVFEDEKSRVLVLRDMNLIPPEVGILDEPLRCYPVNKEWAKIIMGMVSWLAHVAPWRDAQNDRYIGITEVLEFMMSGEDCLKFELRQSPTNDCILEQSLDGGETWSTAFDYSLCDKALSKTLTFRATLEANIDLVTTLINNYNTNYVDSVDDVGFGELEFGVGNDASLKRSACSALRDLVHNLCNVAIESLQEAASEQDDDITFAIAVGGIVLGALGLFVGAPVSIGLAGLGLATGLGGIFLTATGALAREIFDFIQDSSITPFQDETAKTEVICHMLEEMKTGSTSHADLIASTAGFSGSANATTIIEFIDLWLPHGVFYMAFLQAFRQYDSMVNAGIYTPCPCEFDWCYEIDFTAGTGGFMFDVPDREGWGAYIGGEGFRDEWNSVGGEPFGASCYIQLDFPVPTFLGTTEWTYDCPSGDGTNRNMSVTALYQGDVVGGNPSHKYFSPATGVVRTVNIFNAYVDTIRFSFSRELPSAPGANAMYIRSVQFEGIGENPFPSGDNC